jgi:hypothetical protein
MLKHGRSNKQTDDNSGNKVLYIQYCIHLLPDHTLISLPHHAAAAKSKT